MKVSIKKLNSVLALSGPERYKSFLKTVVDWEEIWGLYQYGWALASTDTGQKVFPLWPAKEYAELCSGQEWIGYESRKFSLEDLIGELLPSLKKDGVLPGIFYTPSDKGITPTVDKLLVDLNEELENY
jgi:hypothetical protein